MGQQVYTRWIYSAVPPLSGRCFNQLINLLSGQKTPDSRPSVAAHICCTFLRNPPLMLQSEATHSHLAVQICIGYVL